MFDEAVSKWRANRINTIRHAHDVLESVEVDGWLTRTVVTVATVLVFLFFTGVLLLSLIQILLWDVPVSVFKVLVLAPLLSVLIWIDGCLVVGWLWKELMKGRK